MAPSSAAHPAAEPSGEWASANRAETNALTLPGSPRGASASGPNAARATVPSRSVKPWGPMTSSPSSVLPAGKACKVGNPSDASAIETWPSVPNRAFVSVWVRA